MRLRKNDPTGSYSYLADGVSPASPVLTDGHTTFTPGISEVNALGSRFYLPDAQGNSRGLLDGNQSVQDGYNWDAFGNSVSRFGSNPTGFAWNVSSGYQSDGDSGLKLLGHRYFDSRTGRFITQDPAGDGDNWYAYADNDPVDGVDPTGLDPVEVEDPNGYHAVPGSQWGDITCGGERIQPNTTSSTDFGTGFSRMLGGGDSGPSVLQDAGEGFKVGLAAVGSAASFHLWDGGAARHDPSFGVSRGLADVGVMAATAALGGIGAVGREAGEGETLVTHWDTAEQFKVMTAKGLRPGSWVMKGGKNAYNYEMSGVRQLGYNAEHAISEMVPKSSLRWPGFQDGFLEGIFAPIKAALGQRIYSP